MTVHLQRFCPLCDRAFQEGEAVLRCEGCGVMHHPGCWVTNNGCATHSPHEVSALAQAYSTVRPLGGKTLHPAEGTRVIVDPEYGAGDAPVREQPAWRQASRQEELPVIGGQPVAARVQRQREGDGFAPAVAPKRYVPPAGEHHAVRKPLPKIYNRHRIIEYWYVPVAVVLAIITALGVIWVLGMVFGGSDSEKPAETPSQLTPAPTVQSTGTAPSAFASAPAASVTPVPGARFKPGDTAVVTGAGDCLNVRTAPGRTNAQGEPNPAIVCLNDGTEVRILAGPESAGDLKWWKVSTTLGEGWAAEDYLVRKP